MNGTTTVTFVGQATASTAPSWADDEKSGEPLLSTAIEMAQRKRDAWLSSNPGIEIADWQVQSGMTVHPNVIHPAGAAFHTITLVYRRG